jgi:peptidoglycan/LPS O-acetylase OafA/YrhL
MSESVFSVLGITYAPKFLVYLGKIPFGLYVFHIFASELVLQSWKFLENSSAWFLREHSALYPVRFLLTIGMTVLLAHLSYQYFESPFLRLKEGFAFVKSRSV